MRGTVTNVDEESAFVTVKISSCVLSLLLIYSILSGGTWSIPYRKEAMAETIQFIFDKIFKRILTLSAKAVINLINGLFGTNYPEDSKITYNWTEFEDDNLRKTLADTIVTINDTYSYHMEAQMENDSDIVFRVFDYGFQHANREHISQDRFYLLNFPEPKIIYLYSEKEIPEKYTLRLRFGSQGYFDYEVSTFNFLSISLEELNQRKLIILIPFQLLKLRKLLSRTRTPETVKQLQNLIEYDILYSISKNVEVGNISPTDAKSLRELTQKLLRHLYEKYPETEVICDMFDQSLVLTIDPYIEKFEKLDKMEDLEKQLTQTEKQLTQTEEQLSKAEESLLQKEEQLSQKDTEIARLKAELAKRN